MAEIHIEKKQASVWLWVIPVLLVLAIFLWWRNNRAQAPDNRAQAPTDVGTLSTTNAAASTALAEFRRFVGAREDVRDEARQHTFAVEAIRRLATALEAMNPAAAAAPELVEMRRQADALESSTPQSTDHSDYVRAAFVAASNVFGMLPDSDRHADVPGIRAAAEGIKAGTHLLEQKGAVDAFFSAAVRALEAMLRD